MMLIHNALLYIAYFFYRQTLRPSGGFGSKEVDPGSGEDPGGNAEGFFPGIVLPNNLPAKVVNFYPG